MGMSISILAAMLTLGAQTQQISDDAAMANRFSFRFLQAAVPQNLRSNMLLSPLSAGYALGMLANGSSGETRRKIVDAFGSEGLTLDGMNGSFSRIKESLGSSKDVTFEIANGVWLFGDLKPSDNFRNNLRTIYSADAFSFPAPNPDALNSINGWTGEHTHGMIPKILDRLDPSDLFVLVNALAFDGKWTDAFEPSPSPLAFHLIDGTKITKAMTRQASYRYGEVDGDQAISIPYGDGTYQMLTILPKMGRDAGDYLRSLDAARLKSLREGLSSQQVKVTLPKMKSENELNLQDAFTKLGLGDLFVAADFTGIDPHLTAQPPVAKVGKAIQKAFIEWDEKGTKAAVATAIVGTLTAVIGKPKLVTFTADRPFVYVLMNEKTQTLVMSGVCYNPE